MEEFNLLVSLLEHESYRHYNINLAKSISINAAILYSNLTYLDRLFTKDDDGYFYTTSEAIYDNTALTYDMQKTALAKLSEIGLVEVIRKGMPSKNYFRLVRDAQLLRNLITCSAKPQTMDRDFSNHDLGFSRSNNTINNQIVNENNKSFTKVNDCAEAQVTHAPKNNSLFSLPDMPSNDKTSSVSKTKKTQREGSEEKIINARNTGDWSSINYRDLAYCFLMKYEEHYKLKLLDFDIYAAGTIKKFVESYNIQKEHFEKVLDIMFERYENSKLKNEKFFTLTLNSLKQDFIVNELLLGYNGKSDALDRYERISREKIQQYEEQAKQMGITTATKTGEVF